MSNYFTQNAIPALYDEAQEKIEIKLLIKVTHLLVLPICGLQELQYLLYDHTGEVIMDSLKETLINWNLNITKHVYITTDKVSKITGVCTLLRWN